MGCISKTILRRTKKEIIFSGIETGKTLPQKTLHLKNSLIQ